MSDQEKNQFSLIRIDELLICTRINNMKQILSRICLILCSLVIGLSLQDIKEFNSTPVTVRAGLPWNLQLMLPDLIPKNADLYILLQHQFIDPHREPKLTIRSADNKFTKVCSSENNQFTGVCLVPNNVLSPKKLFYIEIVCHAECRIKLEEYLSTLLKLSLGDTYKFNSPANIRIEEIEIEIPAGLVFEQLGIYAVVENIDTLTQSMQFYANYGLNYTPIPSSSYFQLRGVTIPGGGKGIFLSKSDIIVGRWIKILLELPPDAKITFSSKVITTSNSTLNLGQGYFDFATNSAERFYELNLKDIKKSQLATESICLTFLIYSGNPDISISFTNNFSSTITAKNTLGNIVYVLSPSVRAEYSFSGIVYVSVKSMWSTDYYFYAELTGKDYIELKNDFAQYTDLGGKDIQNYIFQDVIWVQADSSVEDAPLRNYTIKIEISNGNGKFGVRTCTDYFTNTNTCILNHRNDLNQTDVQNQFSNISTTIKRSGYSYYIFFSYDIRNCNSKQLNSTSASRFDCIFHLYAVSQDPEIDVSYTLSVHKREYASILKEGHPTRDTILKDQYLYYEFRLPNVAEISQINFLTTLIEGDITVIIGNAEADQYPTLESKPMNMRVSNGKRITFAEKQISPIFYIGIYGKQVSQFTINVLLERQKFIENDLDNFTETEAISKELTPINLYLGVLQHYTLDEGYSQVTFTLISKQAVELRVTVIEIVGAIWMTILDSENQTVLCEVYSKRSCDFTSLSGETYRVVITSRKEMVQQFIIVYDKGENCLEYNLNHPLFVELHAHEPQCSVYSINKAVDLKLSLSLSILHLFQSEIQVTLCINQNCHQTQKSHHRIIPKQQLENSCNLNNGSDVFAESCIVKISYQSKGNSGFLFNMILSQMTKDITLFDGVIEKIVDQKLSLSSGKYFSYEMLTKTNLKLFFTSLSLHSYYMAVQFISQELFNRKQSTEVYPPYRNIDYSNLSSSLSKNNILQSILTESELFLSISASDIIANCHDDCIMIISVFPYSEIDEDQLFSFEIQVTQTQSFLFFGEVKRGYLEKDQVFIYSFQGASSSKGILTMRDMNKESNLNKNCYSLRLVDGGNAVMKLSSDTILIESSKSDYQLYVESMTDGCSYQISYGLLEAPIVSAQQFTHYEVSVKDSKIRYFLYFHMSEEAFLIREILMAGESLMFVSPIDEQFNTTFDSVFNSDLSDYSFSNQEGQLLISNLSQHFCVKCYYLIAVQANPNLKSEIIIIPPTKDLPMTVNGMVTDKVQLASGSYQKVYSFYSLRSFNISVGLFYGQIDITVFGPQKNIILNQVITKQTVLMIPLQQQNAKGVEWESGDIKFTITVSAVDEKSFYSLQFKRYEVSVRLFSGVPALVNLVKDQTFTFQYLNLQSESTSNSSFFFLVELLNSDVVFNAKSDADFKLDVTVSDDNWTNFKTAQILKITRSQNSFNIQLSQIRGVYLLKITPTRDLEANILLARQSLTYLTARSNHLLSNTGIFQLFNPSQSFLIEIFNCLGEVSVEASPKYSDFANGNNTILLEHNNYGGHYVITGENLKGDYFLKIKSKPSAINSNLYLIRYNSFSGSNPYKKMQMISSQIKYSISKTAAIFKISALKYLIDSDKERIDSKYKLYISNLQSSLNQYIKCGIGSIFTQESDQLQVDSKQRTFTVTLSEMEKLVVNKKLYIGAEVISTYSSDSDQKDNIVMHLTYDLLQLTLGHITEDPIPIIPPSDQNIDASIDILQIMIPLLLITILAFFAVRFCIGRYKRLKNNELVEESIDQKHYKENMGAGQSIQIISATSKPSLEGEV